MMAMAFWANRNARFVLLAFLELAVCVITQDGHAEETPAPNAAPRPNVVLIMADDMGFECVSANGSTSYSTPRIDQLAKQGMRFVHAHSQPICTPSRVQIMTGIYNERNYIRFGLLDPEATTFAHLLKSQGYTTCVAGKWQLEGGERAPHHFGFDEHCLWQLTHRPSRYANPGLEVNGKKIDYDQGQYGPDIVTDFICDFVRRKRREPFFVYYPMILPHWPFEPTPDSATWDPKSEGVLKGHGDMAYFRDMVHYTDKMVGKVVDVIDDLGLSENTLIIFTGDNGTYHRIESQTTDGPRRGGKGSTQDAGTHVPFIVRWPGRVKPGTVSKALVDFSDVLPTLVEVAKPQTEVVSERDTFAKEGIDGVSFLPVLDGTRDSMRDWIYCWYHRDGRQDLATQHVRDRHFKLYLDGRFFDVIADPSETLDLSKQLPDVPLSDKQQVAHDRLSLALESVIASSRKSEAVRRHRNISDNE